jgi:hypothetical protein
MDVLAKSFFDSDNGHMTLGILFTVVVIFFLVRWAHKPSKKEGLNSRRRCGRDRVRIP